MRVIDRKVFRDLVHVRGQMIAVALVVACGMAMYVAMVSVYDSLLATRAAYYDRYRFAELFARIKRAPIGVASQISGIPGVATVETRVVQEVMLDVPGLDEPAVGRLVSIPERRQAMLNDLYLRKGSYIEEGRGEQVIVSEAFANANELEPGDSLGAVINGRLRPLRIVGIGLSPEYIYEFGGASIFPDNKRFGVIWIGREELASAFDMRGAFNDLTATLLPGTDEQGVIQEVDHLLDGYGGLGAHGRDEQLSHRFLSDELSQLRTNAVIIPVIFLGVAAFLLNIVLSRLVGTQRDQIAVLKAFGYSNLSIGLHFVKFALAAVIVGAVIGTGLGMWLGNGLTELYARFYRFPFLRYVAGWNVVGTALLIAGGASVIGALNAARRAIRLPPAEAMRPEPPARFKPGLLERIGLERAMSTASRMILRNIERNPMKALLSVLGISFSVAILVTGRFSFDAIDFMNELQFRHIQREDVMLAFVAPRPMDARNDVLHLPGVLRTEVYRSAPARIRNGHRDRQTGIQGVEPHGELRRLLDRSFDRVPVPDDGVILTDRLAENLHVAVGDSLTIEILEGEREVRRVVVAGTIDELLGTSVYMNIAALNRLLSEGPTISGAYVAVDPLRERELYERLKRTPAVAGTMIRRASIESFEKTIAESQGMSNTMIIIFASVIAIGIIYNSARIALSERGRELASLRVLGFTKREIAAMLLGEQAILTLLAIPLGFLIGYAIAAAVVTAFNSDLYRIPLIIRPRTYAYATLVTLLAGVASALLVRRRLYTLDLIEVLKTRE